MIVTRVTDDDSDDNTAPAEAPSGPPEESHADALRRLETLEAEFADGEEDPEVRCRRMLPY